MEDAEPGISLQRRSELEECKLLSFREISFCLNRAAKFFEAVHPFFDNIKACGVAEANSSIIAEGDAGYHGNVRLAQKTVREVLGGKPELADIHENIEGTVRPDDADMFHFREALQHILTAEVEFVPHVSHRLLVSLESGDAPLLSE